MFDKEVEKECQVVVTSWFIQNLFLEDEKSLGSYDSLRRSSQVPWYFW
jgi:hypothetical protein